MTEGDEGVEPAPSASSPAVPADNSIGRLLALSDGVFAIAMTLLALDLKVPAIGNHPSDHQLRHALAQNSASYWAFLVSFLVVASYWGRHRVLMKSVDAAYPEIIRDTLVLLLLVAAIPFPASLIGNYGEVPFTLVVYGGINALATATLMVLSHDVRRLNVGGAAPGLRRNVVSWTNLFVFLLCIPGGYVLRGNGPWMLLLLGVPALAARLHRLLPRSRAAG
jgi:uncharacterized membrane protein